MSDLSAKHYLGIYQRRLSMAESGTTKPEPHVIEFERTLIEKLSGLDSDEKIKLNNTQATCQFIRKKTGEVLAELNL